MSTETSRGTLAAPGLATLLRRHWLWGAAVVAALLLPWLFFDWSTHRHSGFVLTMLSEIGLMSVFALSFNMQMGQAGLPIGTAVPLQIPNPALAYFQFVFAAITAMLADRYGAERG